MSKKSRARRRAAEQSQAQTQAKAQIEIPAPAPTPIETQPQQAQIQTQSEPLSLASRANQRRDEPVTSSHVSPEALAAHDEFVRSPAAVVDSLGIRVSTAVAIKLGRSSVPPPPALNDHAD